MQATYSPEDNKLRLFSLGRLPKELYERVRSAGFIWAPKQQLFVAPMWTPQREDLLLELCGEIGDEDTSLVDRAEERAERFEDYSDSRAQDAEQARAAVARIADGIPMGQPILVGHHSERHARKDAEKIENGMRRAVKMWETSQYWKDRAAGALRHAKYKELPAVRARRIKGLEADLRKQQKYQDHSAKCLQFWTGKLFGNGPGDPTKKIAISVNYSNAIWFTGRHDDFSACFPLDKYPRQAPASQYEGMMSSYSALGSGEREHAVITVEQAQEIAIRVHTRATENRARWIAHLNNRLDYERAMMEESGGTEADRVKPEVGGACKAWCSWRGGFSTIQKVNKVSVTLLDNWGNGGQDFTRTIPFDKLSGLMSKAQVDAYRAAGRLVMETPRGFHLRTAPDPTPEPEGVLPGMAEHVEKQAQGAAVVAGEELTAQANQPKDITAAAGRMETFAPLFRGTEASPQHELFAAMKESLRAGVQVVSAPQLFPTPPALADRMVQLAQIKNGQEVLEPSAGTGAIVDAIRRSMAAGTSGRAAITAVEINPRLAQRLETVAGLGTTYVHAKDFLECNGNLGLFERVIMNPPFENAADVKHILHAVHMLKPGGRLVAICANGPRQQEALRPLATEWEELEAGTFAGTGVRTVLLTIER
jgi:protein-L-isoaspartate O-methyltransferase